MDISEVKNLTNLTENIGIKNKKYCSGDISSGKYAQKGKIDLKIDEHMREHNISNY